MIYQARIKKKISNVKVYVILKKLNSHEGFMTKAMTNIFMRIFSQKGKEEQKSAIEGLK